jgi:hypothetical protein
MGHDAYIIITHKWLKALSWMIRAESVNLFFGFGNFEKFLLEILESVHAISSMQNIS